MHRDGFDGAAAAAASELRVAFQPHPQLPWLVMRRGVITQLAIDAPVTRVPNTQPWLVAMMNLRGVLLPVFDLGRWLGLAPTPAPSTRVLVFDTTGDAAALLCHGDPEIKRLDVADATWTGDPRLTPFLGAGFHVGDDEVFEFDHQYWFTEAGSRAAA